MKDDDGVVDCVETVAGRDCGEAGGVSSSKPGTFRWPPSTGDCGGELSSPAGLEVLVSVSANPPKLSKEAADLSGDFCGCTDAERAFSAGASGNTGLGSNPPDVGCLVSETGLAPNAPKAGATAGFGSVEGVEVPNAEGPNADFEGVENGFELAADGEGLPKADVPKGLGVDAPNAEPDVAAGGAIGEASFLAKAPKPEPAEGEAEPKGDAVALLPKPTKPVPEGEAPNAEGDASFLPKPAKPPEAGAAPNAEEPKADDGVVGLPNDELPNAGVVGA